MKLTVRDAARLLSVSEKSVYRWIKQGVIPVYQINDQYRFNRAELLEWATSRKISVSPEIFAEPEGGETPPPSLSEALRAGGVHYRVAGTDKASVLHAVVDLMKLPDEVDRDFLYQVLLAREALGSTGVGDGIAIPHVRNPIAAFIAADGNALFSGAAGRFRGVGWATSDNAVYLDQSDGKGAFASLVAAWVCAAGSGV